MISELYVFQKVCGSKCNNSDLLENPKKVVHQNSQLGWKTLLPEGRGEGGRGRGREVNFLVLILLCYRNIKSMMCLIEFLYLFVIII